MANEKEAKLSIVIRTVDKATAAIKRINERLDRATKPVRDFKKALGELRENSGLTGVVEGVKGVGSAIAGVLSKVAVFGGLITAAGLGLKSIIDEFDDLGDRAERIGVSVDALAQLRYAAVRSGVEVARLDRGMETFTKNLGLARAGTGSLTAFLKRVSPALLKQLKAAKSNEEAFGLLADAMAKVHDPAKRAALAQQAFGDAAAAPLLAKGSKGIQELRARYAELAGPQGEATAAAGEFGDSMDDLKAATDGIKAALVTGLAPALKIIVDRLREWFVAHRGDIAQWARDIGEKLPGAVKKIVEWVENAVAKVSAFIDGIGGIKNAAIAAAAIMAGPLLASVVNLGAALLTAGSRAVQLIKALRGVAAAQGAAGAAGAGGAAAAAGRFAFLGPVGLAIGGAYLASELTGGPIGEGRGGVLGIAREELERRARLKALKAQGRTELTDMVFRGMERARADADLTAEASDVVAGARGAQTEAKVTIDIANAPRGTRVRTDPQSTADIDLLVGYQMLPGGAL